MYRESCEAADEELELKMQQVQVKVFGFEPPVVEEVEEE